MGAVRAFFLRHPGWYSWTNRALYAAAGVLLMKDELLEVVGYVPENTLMPKILGWVLAGAAFSRLMMRVLLGRVVAPGVERPDVQETAEPGVRVIVGTEDPSPPSAA